MIFASTSVSTCACAPTTNNNTYQLCDVRDVNMHNYVRVFVCACLPLALTTRPLVAKTKITQNKRQQQCTQTFYIFSSSIMKTVGKTTRAATLLINSHSLFHCNTFVCMELCKKMFACMNTAKYFNECTICKYVFTHLCGTWYVSEYINDSHIDIHKWNTHI